MNIVAEKKFAAFLSITSNALVISFKVVAGILSGSISIISEAIHSLSDFLASVLTFFAVTRSAEPADKGHPFGHGKYEDMSGFIEGGLIVFAGLYIIYEAIEKLINGYYQHTETSIGILAMGFAVLANFLVSRYLFYVAKKSDSVSLYADAKHLSTDIYSSLGVFIGLLLIKVTGLAILDPIIALVVALIILKAGFSISKETLNNLLDGSIPTEDIQKIEEIIKANSVIKGCKGIKGRNPKTTFIAYGADLTLSKLKDDDEKLVNWYKEKGLKKKEYYLVVGRFVPENSFEVMIREFMKSNSKKDFALITNVNEKFLNELEQKLHFKSDKRIKFVGTVYDQELLKKIRENAYAYFHGHTVGGTNPSLIEALGSTDLNMLVDVGFNKEVAQDCALYWSREEGSLSKLIGKADAMSEDEIKKLGEKAKKRVSEEYTWEKICGMYKKVFI